MTIITDLETSVLRERLTENAEAIISNLKEFIHQRLKVLEDRINKEGGTITFCFLSKPPGLLFEGFSNDLMEKMGDCFTESDFRYFLSKF